MGLMLTASTLGFLGPGPLSAVRVERRESAMTLEYQRFERHERPFELKVRFFPEAAANGAIRLRLAHDYLSKVRIESVDPEPVAEETGAKATTFVFKPADPRAESLAVFHFESGSMGRARGEISVEACRCSRPRRGRSSCCSSCSSI